MRYLARQPIVDARGKILAYELLFRSRPSDTFDADGIQATRTVLDDVALFGIHSLTGGLPAFINCTRESLTGRMVEVLPPETAVLEVLETIEPDKEVIAACRYLKSAGYRIALDDFLWQPGMKPLVELADYIKVDFLAADTAMRVDLRNRIGKSKVILVAEKIETDEDYQQARKEGYSLFQGYYFFRPVLMRNSGVPANCMLHMDILKCLQEEPLALHELSQLVKRDPALTLRLLRLANSAICAIQERVQSIQSAMLMMGDDMLRKVLTLAITCEWNTGRPPAVLNLSFTRARFCELAATFCGQEPNEQYLVGLLSLLPAMLHLPMEELTPALPLRPAVCSALKGEENRERTALRLVENLEQGCWECCDVILQTNGLDEGQISECYREAAAWAEAACRAST